MKRTPAENLKRRHLRVRKNLIGTSEKPRLCIYKSDRHLYAQIVDDVKDPKGGTALVSITTNTKENRELNKNFRNSVSAKKLGVSIAEKAKAKGITKVVFDRSGYIYHGIVKTFAESAREGGLIF